MERTLRIYTVAEANALLPELSARVTDQFRLLRAIEVLVEQLRVACGPAVPSDLRTDPSDASGVAEAKSSLRTRLAEMRTGAEAIEATGAIIKDLRNGVIDFYARRDRVLVSLCWRFGETTVRYWHPLDANFSDRRRLDEARVGTRTN
jgi:hypothetical protein